jgi:hypothetical protein
MCSKLILDNTSNVIFGGIGNPTAVLNANTPSEIAIAAGCGITRGSGSKSCSFSNLNIPYLEA